MLIDESGFGQASNYRQGQQPRLLKAEASVRRLKVAWPRFENKLTTLRPITTAKSAGEIGKTCGRRRSREVARQRNGDERIKMRVEDALNATKAAAQEGTVPGAVLPCCAQQKCWTAFE